MFDTDQSDFPDRDLAEICERVYQTAYLIFIHDHPVVVHARAQAAADTIQWLHTGHVRPPAFHDLRTFNALLSVDYHGAY